MWQKNNGTWDRIENLYDTNVFNSILDKLKTYSKCVNASTYNTTRTLSDVYENIKYQHALWVHTTNFAETDIELMGLTIQRGKFYNLLKHFTCKQLSDSVEFRQLLEYGILKASNPLLFEDLTNDRQSWFCAYQPKKTNLIIDKPFDYIVLRYILKDPNSQDIDTRTAIIDTGSTYDYKENGSLTNTPIDGNDIGFDRGRIISNINDEAYLTWGGDNTSSEGGESILIDFKKISEDLSYLDTIKIRLRAYFYVSLGNGQIEVELTTYKGGTMEHIGTDFVNNGGVLVQQITIDRQLVTQSNSNVDGDDLGTLVYNTQTSNAIITDLTQVDGLSFSDILNTIDFNQHTWNMGTSGLNVELYNDMLIDHTFTCEDLEQYYQTSYKEYGYSQKNVFTSTKTWEKLLNNFHVIDVASTEHLDITTYSILDIDGVRIVNNHRILLKNQNNSLENGIYVYNDSTLTKEDITDYLSVFVKEGITNKNKEFFLERTESGKFPTEETPCGCSASCIKYEFIEGNNYVLRNRASYKLLADHTFTDANYFTQLEPITTVDYTGKYYTNTGYYIVNDNTLEYYVNDTLIESYKTDNLNNRIENDLYLLRKNELLQFVNEEFVVIQTLDYDCIDFQFTDKWYFLSNDKIYTDTIIELKPNVKEFRIIDDFIFYLTNDSLCVYYNGNHKLIDITADKLRLELSGNDILISYLTNDFPNTIKIDKTELINLLTWGRGNDYKLIDFSKTEIGDWKIENNNLFFKNSQITNSTNVPKLNDNYYDGVDDYAVLDVSLTKSFTIEFKVNPTNIRPNQPVFYFGNEKTVSTYKLGTETIVVNLPPTKYMVFYLDEFAKFKVNNIEVIATKRIEAETHVSITWSYSVNKTTCNIYYDAVLVATKTISPIDVTLINIEKAYFGKSEFDTNPLFEGYLKDFRIWDKVLNSVQIATRINKTITATNDNFFTNLTYYNDVTFYGTLNDDALLKEIQSPQLIQLNNDYLYLLDKKPIEIFESKLNGEEFNGTDYSNKVVNGTLRLVTTGLTKNIIVNDGDDITVEVETIGGKLDVDGTIQTSSSTAWELLTIQTSFTSTNNIEISLSPNNVSFFRNFKLTINRTLYPINDIYKINLKQESISLVHNTTNQIDSIYLDNEQLYYLENNSVYGNSLVYTSSYNIVDFAHFNNVLYLLDDNGDIYVNDNLVYSGITNAETIYGYDNILYWKEPNAINILEYNTVLEYIAKYPFIDNKEINNYKIVNNRLLLNDVDLDTTNEKWGLNLKDLWGIYENGTDIIIGVRTIDNEIQLWLHNTTSIKFLNGNTNTLFYNDSYVDLVTFDDWIIISNVNEIIFYKKNIDKLSKFNYKLPFDGVITEIEYNDKLWIKTLDSITTLSSDSFNLLEDVMEYEKTTTGWLIGESGLLFTNLEINNIVFKDDFRDLEVIKHKVDRNLGYKVTEWSNIAWIVGDKGRIIRTLDGVNWEVLNSNVYHNLTSCSFINENDGLIVGLNGTILSTFSGGNSFFTIQSDIIDWKKVLYYDIDKAIIIGDYGKIIHLKRENYNWKISKVLNNTELAKLQIQIKQENLTNNIDLIIEDDFYQQTLRSIEYIGNNEFIIVGDSDLICKLKIVEQIDYIEPYLSFYRSNLNIDWNDVIHYTDLNTNENTLFLLAKNDIYTTILNGLNKVNLYISSEYEIKTIELYDNHLIYAGKHIQVCNKTLYTEDSTCFDLSELFKPRMLFLDYYMGRKINIHLDVENYVKPIGKLDKSKLDCFYFKDGEYIEFSDINNYLAYQDHYYLNRRLLDVPNSWGKIQKPYNKYNKRITALDDYSKASWTDTKYQFVNESVTNLSTFVNGELREDINITKLKIGITNNTQYNLTGIITNRTYKVGEIILENGIYQTTIRVDDNSIFNINDYVKMDNSDYPFKVIEISNLISSDNITIEGIQVINDVGTVEKVTIKVLDLLQKNDVIGLTVIDNDKSKALEVGNKLYYQLLTEALDVNEVVTVEEKNTTENKIVFKDFEIAFDKGSTTNDVYQRLIGVNSPSLQVANQLLNRRCYATYTESFKVFDNMITQYYSTTTNNNGIYIEELNKLIIGTSSPNRIQIINTISNLIEKEIIVNACTYFAYSPKYKKLYVSGGDFSNHKVNVIDMLSYNKETIDLGVTGKNMIYNKSNQLVYIATNNGYKLIDNTTINNTVNVIANKHVYVDSKNDIYTITNTNIQIIKNSTVIKTINQAVKHISYNGGDFVFLGSDNAIYKININTNNIDSGFNINIGSVFKQISYGNVNRLFISDNSTLTIYDDGIIKTIDVGFEITDVTYLSGYVYIGGVGKIVLLKANVGNTIYETLDIEYNLLSGNVNKLISTDKVYLLTSNGNHLVSLTNGVFTPSNIEVKLNNLVTTNTAIVKDIKNDKITLYDLWNDEMVYESNNKTLLFRNLNYFNKDLIHLKEVFDNHYLGDSYNITVNDDDIIIEGNVNELTKYYNLESIVTFKTYTIDYINIQYDKDLIYTPNYSLLSFLSNLNPIFTYSYEFDMPNEYFDYQPLIRTSNNEFIEFRIEKNIIYIGGDYSNKIKDYKKGLFIDIINGNKAVNRVYIKDIKTEYYSKYDKLRYIITTDKQLEDNLNLSGTVQLRSRNKLGEISLDLEFTDDIMFPLDELFNNRYYNNSITSYQYARILSNDNNIRNEVSSIIHLDETNDWILNVIDWKNDPNFNYRPLDLHEVGVDRVFKKGISIDSSNYYINDGVLSLVNVDFDKYNYRIVDGMTLKELETDYYWVLNADIRNAIIGKNDKGFVWYQGDWLCGTWEEGTWYSGKAFNIEWEKGDVYSNKVINNFNLISTIDNNDSSNTIWYNALWLGGNWFNGTWSNGQWLNGSKFKGVWNNGTWYGGTWLDGDFKGGVWLDGTWLNGTFSRGNTFSIWTNGKWLGGDFENGTWLNGIFDQSNIVSRFGTKSSLLKPATWEYGIWKNGEFHSNISNLYSVWKNGIWKKGVFYGGTWEFGVWENGLFVSGFWKSNLEIAELRVRYGNELIEGSDIEVEFTTPHYYKTNIEVNSFIIMGKPLIIEGEIHPNVEALGYNTKPKKHIIKEILDEKTVLINIDDNIFPYNSTGGVMFNNITSTVDNYNNSTCGISGTELCPCDYECTDYTKIIVQVEDSIEIPTETLTYDTMPLMASYWIDGKHDGGIWDYGYFSNGTWRGGLWNDGVFEDGFFSS